MFVIKLSTGFPQCKRQNKIKQIKFIYSEKATKFDED